MPTWAFFTNNEADMLLVTQSCQVTDAAKRKTVPFVGVFDSNPATVRVIASAA